MARSCTVCSHPDHTAIADALAKGRSLREIAAQFGVSKTALHRHYHHLLAVVETLEKSSAQKAVTLPRSESRSWTFPRWVWRQVWGRKGVLAIVAGGIGYTVRAFTSRR
jgi:hypothetical protein